MKERMKMKTVETKFGPIGENYEFEGVRRKDGKEFTGEIVRILNTNRGTLVTLMTYGETGKEYRNLYLDECEFTVNQPAWA
jgi:hypothetical protein